MLDDADEVELVDMSPHALRQRMRHGNVYPPERTEVALDRFFTEPNLTALREIALRRVARQVDAELEEVGAGQARAAFGTISERVLVVVDGSRADRAAVRRAAMLAGALRGTVAGAAGRADRERRSARPSTGTLPRRSRMPRTWVRRWSG